MEREMVFRRDDKGGGWHEPPYTWEEEMEFYRPCSVGMASGKATIPQPAKRC